MGRVFTLPQAQLSAQIPLFFHRLRLAGSDYGLLFTWGGGTEAQHQRCAVTCRWRVALICLCSLFSLSSLMCKIPSFDLNQKFQGELDATSCLSARRQPCWKLQPGDFQKCSKIPPPHTHTRGKTLARKRRRGRDVMYGSLLSFFCQNISRRFSVKPHKWIF